MDPGNSPLPPLPDGMANRYCAVRAILPSACGFSICRRQLHMAVLLYAKGATIRSRMHAIAQKIALLSRVGLLAVFANLLSAQSFEGRLGRVGVMRSELNEVQIRRGDQVWHVDLSRLIRKNDCAEEAICLGRPTMPCPDCPRRVEFISWDDNHRKLYFAIATGISKNNPWTIFSYSLATHRVARFTNTWSASLQRGVVCRSGRYLAYVNIYHGGDCANSDAIEVVDLWQRRVASLAIDSSDLATIERIEWSSDAVLHFEGTQQSESDCLDEKKTPERLSGNITVSSSSFR
jgi:hypothetical protein